MKRFLIFLLALAMLPGMLMGCRTAGQTQDPTGTVPRAPETTEPGPTVPQDGNPDDVTCKGTYSETVDAAKVVARVGDAELTNGVLQAFYWAEVAAYRQGIHEIGPDFAEPLDTQPCPLDESVGSWQQYFLKRALDTWHSAQALALQGRDEGLPTEEAYKPNEENHEKYMTGMPANRVLYGYYDEFVPNSMHQAYLDDLPAMLEALAQEKGYADGETMAREAFGTSFEDLCAYAELYNWGYMYFTSLSYELGVTDEAAAAYAEEQGFTRGQDRTVDIRQMLLQPQPDPYVRAHKDETVTVNEDGTVTCSEVLWEHCERNAQAMLRKWAGAWNSGEATFADMANDNSVDRASAPSGGSYRNLVRGQLLPELEAWCFDPERQPGDTTIIRTAYGIHVLYFSRGTDLADARAREALTAEAQRQLIADAKETYPMKADYASMSLSTAEAAVGSGDILYPDVAHERFPEAPLYLQQDYPDTRYGAYPIRTHGCGVTTMAMLASYMSDTIHTPPELCARYARYSSEHGTDGMMFRQTPAEFGFYLRDQVFNPKEALDALKEGYPVVTIQVKGYWTRGGHYLLLEKVTEDDMVQVRDSNIFNYGRLENHKNDLFEWKTIPPGAKGFWIYEKKVTNIPACIRCGDPEDQLEGLIPSDYICEKCAPALLRRDTYLNGMG